MTTIKDAIGTELTPPQLTEPLLAEIHDGDVAEETPYEVTYYRKRGGAPGWYTETIATAVLPSAVFFIYDREGFFRLAEAIEPFGYVAAVIIAVSVLVMLPTTDPVRMEKETEQKPHGAYRQAALGVR